VKIDPDTHKEMHSVLILKLCDTPPKPVTMDVEGPVKSSTKPAQGNETTPSDGVVAENNSLPYG
jgi:hypothetical protein